MATPTAPDLPTRWLNVYRVWMALSGLTALVVGVRMLVERGHGGLPGGLLAFALTIPLLWVSIGLGLRDLWAWRLNYWGFLVLPLVLAGFLTLSSLVGLLLIVTGLGHPLGSAEEVFAGLLGGLVMGTWWALNLRYFSRRRSLFS